MLRGRLEKWGPQVFLNGAAVACTYTGPNAIRYVQPAHSVLVHLATEPQWQRSLNSDRKITGVAPVGAIDIVPANGDTFGSWSTKKHSVRLDVDPARLERLAGSEFDKETFELRSPKLGFIDKQIYSLSLWIQEELENGDACSLEALDALATIFSTYLLRNYSSLNGCKIHLLSGGLTPISLRRVNDFIQANLREDLSLEKLASIALLSPSHFTRAFRQATGQSPHQFVMMARLAYARNQIADTNAPFSHIARSAGFSSNSHMTAMMRRVLNTTPMAFRRNRMPD